MFCIYNDIEKYLDNIELVVVGGESDINARIFDYSWALDIREQCIRKEVSFEFRQCGTYTIKDGKQYKIQTKDLCKQAKLANIDYKSINSTTYNYIIISIIPVIWNTFHKSINSFC